MRRLIIQIIIGIVGLWIATHYIRGVIIKGEYYKELLLVGTILGLVNFFLKPIVNLITFPLRLLTLGLFSFVISIVMIWLVDILSAGFDIIGIIPLFWTTVLIWALGFIIPVMMPERRKTAANLIVK